MTDFVEIADTLVSNGAALQVSDQQELLEKLMGLLEDPSSVVQMGENGGNLFQAGKGAIDKIQLLIGDYV